MAEAGPIDAEAQALFARFRAELDAASAVHGRLAQLFNPGGDFAQLMLKSVVQSMLNDREWFEAIIVEAMAARAAGIDVIDVLNRALAGVWLPVKSGARAPEPPAGIWTEDPAVEGPFVALVRDTPVDVATRNPNFREGSRHHARAKQFLTPKLFADVYGQQQQWILAVGGKLAAGWRLPDGAVLEPSGHVVASPKKAGSSGS